MFLLYSEPVLNYVLLNGSRFKQKGNGSVKEWMKDFEDQVTVKPEIGRIHVLVYISRHALDRRVSYREIDLSIALIRSQPFVLKATRRNMVIREVLLGGSANL